MIGPFLPRRVLMKRASSIRDGDWICLTWIDSTSNCAIWSEPDDVRKLEPQRAYSVGRVICNARDYIVIAAHVGDNPQDYIAGDMAIPWRCVEGWRRIRFMRVE